MVSGCSNKTNIIFDNCSFVAKPISELTGSKKVSNKEVMDMIDDPIHNVAGVISCKF